MSDGSLFGDIFGASPQFPNMPTTTKPEPKVEKGVPWHAKLIDQKYYVPLDDVLELLKVNDILPAVRAGIEKRIEEAKTSG